MIGSVSSTLVSSLQDRLQKESASSSKPLLCEIQKVPVPASKLAGLKAHWVEVIKPVVELAKLQIRMNVGKKTIEVRASPTTEDLTMLPKSVEYLKAYVAGFSIVDSEALLRLDDMFLESFEISDVKRLQGGHLDRAIGRVIGSDGKVKLAVENATRTRISVSGNRIYMLGSFANLKTGRNVISQLVMGASPSKIFEKLKIISRRFRDAGY